MEFCPPKVEKVKKNWFGSGWSEDNVYLGLVWIYPVFFTTVKKTWNLAQTTNFTKRIFLILVDFNTNRKLPQTQCSSIKVGEK